ncbi:uncharacterized protein LOC123226433 [Mangifera indica]|uniref:uncharacterized protein LOC123226433 n=1 Tax=Mangifera indica TaxID=29780 RepID=UPI001CFA775C|nr:uncharacterized protein LOC123226433 [Mangifera indica]
MAEKSEDIKKKSVCVYDSDSSQEDAGSDFDLPLMKLSLGPRKKLLVLSLGGLLCHRVHRRERTVSINRSPDANFGNFKIYKRPYCTDFMKFCLERFEVIIWSAAIERNMNGAMDCIMMGLRDKILFAWDQRKCTDGGINALEMKGKPVFLKELKKIWEESSVISKHKDKFSSSNTLLIDTHPYRALLNPPNTAVFLTEYEATHVSDKALGPGGELREYLDGVVDAADVPSYVKEHPFGQPAMTPMHPDWDHYSKILTCKMN